MEAKLCRKTLRTKIVVIDASDMSFISGGNNLSISLSRDMKYRGRRLWIAEPLASAML